MRTPRFQHEPLLFSETSAAAASLQSNSRVQRCRVAVVVRLVCRLGRVMHGPPSGRCKSFSLHFLTQMKGSLTTGYGDHSSTPNTHAFMEFVDNAGPNLKIILKRVAASLRHQRDVSSRPVTSILKLPSHIHVPGHNCMRPGWGNHYLRAGN